MKIVIRMVVYLFFLIISMSLVSCSDDEGSIKTGTVTTVDTTGDTADTTSPQAPTVSTPSISSLTSSSLTLEWNAATDETTSESNLTYLAYQSATDNIDTVDNIAANGTAIGTYQANTLTTNASSLSSTTKYYFNVIAQDEAGNKTAYTATSTATIAVGSLDTDFSEDGVATINDIPGAGDNNELAYGVIVDTSDRTVVVGYANNGSNDDLAVLRYEKHGTLDSTFGTNGKVVIDNISGVVAIDRSIAIAADSNGKLLITGYCNSVVTPRVFAIRLNTDGSLDGTFGTGGKYVSDNTYTGITREIGYAITVDGDGNVLVAGYGYNGTNNVMLLLRLTEDGALDSSFGSLGVVTSDGLVAGSGSDVGYGIIVDDSNRILVVGSSYNGSNEDMAIWRFNSDGSPDDTFGNNGLVNHHGAAGGNGSDYGTAITIDSNNRILVTGYSLNGTYDMVIWRYDSSGNLDTDFNSSGVVSHASAAGFDGFDRGNAITTDAAGNIIVAGYSENGTDEDMVVWRYTDGGALDTTFAEGVGFMVQNDSGGGTGTLNDKAAGVAVTSENRIAAAGYTWGASNTYDFAVWMIE